ncbi:MAG: hypothetical protein PWQ93_204 [Clostridiales bacterium]|nr:hypothetical protein [Clostridiales bacterium]
MAQRIYAVITSDIIGSRRLKDRNISRQDIEDAIDRLNKEDDNFILSRFRLLRGDEIQGVVRSANDAAVVIRHLRFCINPAVVRIGIGLGDIATNIDRDNPWNMDGNAFHRARQALDDIKHFKRQATALCSEDKALDDSVNVIFALMDALSSKWTKAQWEAVHVYERAGTYSKAAEILAITMQNVAKRCSAARWDAFRKGEEHIARLIANWVKSREGG